MEGAALAVAMMNGKISLVVASAIALSACAPLYSTTRDWRTPPLLGNYELSATLSVGIFTWGAAISVNGRELLSGQSFFWTDTVAMSGTIDQFPIAAICAKNAKTCDVTIAGIHAGVLRF